MKKHILAPTAALTLTALALIALVLMASCSLMDINTTLEGTWVGETDLRNLSYTFNSDGTFSYTLKDKKTGREITHINGSWKYGHEGYIVMSAPITIYESRYTEDYPGYVFIKTGDPESKLIYFGRSMTESPYNLDTSLFREYETDGNGTYTYADSLEYDDHGVTTWTKSARRFKFEDGHKCTYSTQDTTDFENGSYAKSTKTYTFYAEDPDVIGEYVRYKIYNDMMISEDEELTYTITGKTLTLGRMNQVLTKK